MAEKKVRISIEEAVRYMGYKHKPNENEMKMITECRDMLLREIKPAWVYRAFDIENCADGIRLSGTQIILSGKDIKRQLDGCERCILLCATVSVKADELIRRREAEDIALGFMTDCLASAAVESVCNAAEDELAERLEGKYLTWRFSPGYGDLPLEIQPQIISVLNAQKRAGVSCTDSLLLLPRKSVTAIIGISDKPIEKGRRGCAVCSMAKTCQFRKRGTHCGA